MATSKPKRTEKELIEMCRAAILPVVQKNKGILGSAIRREMRKAFPFGPNATEREKRIYEKMMQDTENELQKWECPKAPMVALLVALCLNGLPCSAQDSQGQNLQPQTFMTQLSLDPEADAQPLKPEMPPVVTAPAVKQKTPFSVKHPKIWKHYRKARKFAIKTKPWVDYAGSCAQVTYSIVQFFI